MIKNSSNKIFLTVLLISAVFSLKLIAQAVTVQVDLNCERYIGGVSELDRTKYFSIHDAGTEADKLAFRNEYNVTGGRQFWGPLARAKQVTGVVGQYPADKPGNNDLRAIRKGYVSTQHPRDAFIDGIDVVKAADWAAEYFKDDIANGEAQEFVEVMNEPFVHAKDFYSGGWSISENNRIKLQMAKLYNEVGKRIHETPALDNMKVIGYSSAWPSMELDDFGHWNDNMKMFMDNAGDNMFGFSTHLYDGINIAGQDTKRSGSNSEAILDLIENYSFIKWNIIKPHAITEYGGIEKGYGDDYSDIASSQTLISINHILFNLLDRQDRLVNSIPFITGKAEWHINATNNYQPYQAVLWKPTNIGQPTPAGWEYTPRINFYELWKDVKGKRIMIKSDNPDVQTHAFVDTNKMYVGLSNLDENSQIVNLTMLSSIADLVNVKIKDLKTYAQALPDMTITTVTEAPSSITLIKDETVVLEYTFNNPVTFNNALRENNYYTTNYLQPISANSTISYTFNNVIQGNGFATLRMSIGRKHNVSKKPIVKVNGTVIEVPDNWKGYDQANRDDFFGMIEIPFSSYLLLENNQVTVEFPDSGGRISSLILSVHTYDVASSVSTLAVVQSTGNACPGTSNGTINIKPLLPDTYQVHITGDTINETYDFSQSYDIENLASGTYAIVITSTTNVDLKTEYVINITQPEPLAVSNRIVNSKLKEVSYQLDGGSHYTIKINNEVYSTSSSNISLPLESGTNSIEIIADAACQGIFKDEMYFNQIVGYPNPFSNNFNLDLGSDESNKASIKIYNSVGALVSSKEHIISKNSVTLDTKFLTPGLYILSVETDHTSEKLKIIKLYN
jgi:hypothetical protein